MPPLRRLTRQWPPRRPHRGTRCARLFSQHCLNPSVSACGHFCGKICGPDRSSSSTSWCGQEMAQGSPRGEARSLQQSGGCSGGQHPHARSHSHSGARCVTCTSSSLLFRSQAADAVPLQAVLSSLSRSIGSCCCTDRHRLFSLLPARSRQASRLRMRPRRSRTACGTSRGRQRPSCLMTCSRTRMASCMFPLPHNSCPVHWPFLIR